VRMAARGMMGLPDWTIGADAPYSGMRSTIIACGSTARLLGVRSRSVMVHIRP
jgi:hypothetical protein